MNGLWNWLRKMYKVGFSGTQKGMTLGQQLMFDAIVIELNSIGMTEFHHGDCIGSDKEAHDAIVLLSKHFGKPIKTIIHPPKKKAKRAFCAGDESRKPLSYLDRNQAIANEIDMLVATPQESKEAMRSGTWATIRRARKQEKPVLIINPDGSLDGDSIETIIEKQRS